ncbi:hypothetical protein EJB05_14452, partial [Eragrostis curvula]
MPVPCWQNSMELMQVARHIAGGDRVAAAPRPGASRMAALFAVRPSPSSPRRRRHSDLRSKAPAAFKGAACRLAACPVFVCAPVQGIRISFLKKKQRRQQVQNGISVCYSCDLPRREEKWLTSVRKLSADDEALSLKMHQQAALSVSLWIELNNAGMTQCNP